MTDNLYFPGYINEIIRTQHMIDMYTALKNDTKRVINLSKKAVKKHKSLGGSDHLWPDLVLLSHPVFEEYNKKISQNEKAILGCNEALKEKMGENSLLERIAYNIDGSMKLEDYRLSVYSGGIDYVGISFSRERSIRTQKLSEILLTCGLEDKQHASSKHFERSSTYSSDPKSIGKLVFDYMNNVGITHAFI